MSKGREYKRSYFQKLLFYFIAMSLIPILATGTAVYLFSLNVAENNILTQANSSMSKIQDGFEKMTGQYTSAATLLSQEKNIVRYLQEGDKYYYDANYTVFLIMGGKNAYADAHVVSASHDIGISTASRIPDCYRYPYNVNWGIFRMLNTTGGTALAANKISSDSDVIFSVGSPVIGSDGDTVGYVIIDMYRRCVEEWLPAEIIGGYGYELTIANANSYVAYSSLGAAFEGLNRLPGHISAPLSSGARNVQVNGEKRSIQIHKQEDAQVYIIYDIPLFLAARNIQPILTIVSAICIVSLLVSTVVSFLVAKGVSRPIHQLSSAMSTVEQGNFDVHLDFKTDGEIGMLDRKFNSMVRQLETLIWDAEEKQRQLRIAESKELQAQIKPHFLYNTLDLIKWSAKLGNLEIVDVIVVRLGKLLRQIVSAGEDFCTLDKELELVENYAAIQKIRYGDRLKVVLEVEDDVRGLMIPKLILQPLVENAILHGLEDKVSNGRLLLACKIMPPYLILTVTDNGCGIERQRLNAIQAAIQNQQNGTDMGIGLYNVAIRAALYGDEHCGLRIQSEEGAGTTVEVTILPQQRRNVV